MASVWTKLIGGRVVIALAVIGLWLFGNARYTAGQMAERAAWERSAAKAAVAMGKASLALQRRSSAAVEAHAERVIHLQPIIHQSRETVRVFAQTPDGARRCLSDDRVQSIANDRAALFDLATNPEGGAGTVPPVPAAER